MLKHVDTTEGEMFAFMFEGRSMTARSGDTVASALLAAGEAIFRSSPISGAPRGPFCMMGVCFECLVEIDGVSDRQACMVSIVEGMVIRRQRSPWLVERP